jgi:hypothetical protein
LADASPAGPVPLLAVAGAAMHRGDGQMALDTIDLVTEFVSDRSAGTFEGAVVRAIACVQLGRLDEAMTMLESIPDDGIEHPFAHVAWTLVLALAGDPDGALREAEAVTAVPGSTYLDRAITAVAVAGAHGSRGDEAAAEAALDAALVECLEVGDVVAIALLQGACCHILGRAHASGSGDMDALGAGWLHVIASLPALQRVA